MTVGKKFAYADNLTILLFASDWQALEGTLTQNMATLSSYLYKWNLKLSTTKTVSQPLIITARKHDVSLTSLSRDRPYRLVLNSLNLGTKMNRALAYRRHLGLLRKKLTSHVGLLKLLAGSSWGADATVLRAAILILVYSTAEYCAPV